VDRFLKESVGDEPVFGARSVAKLVGSLERPRRVLLMVKAGAPVDATIEQLLEHLQQGDMIIDAGNSHPRDTERRAGELKARGLEFVGMGVSGGEEGALNGPSLMPGGAPEAYSILEPVLTRIAAQVEDGPCVTHVGPGAAGHFVKMVHNGIEYGDMQLIAECFDFMQIVLGMDHKHMADVFERWNDGLLESYLIEITGKILAHVDPETSRPMVEVILDRAGQKGTGRWTSEIGLEMGVPLPTIHAAVEARGLSSIKEERVAAEEVLRGPRPDALHDPTLIDALHDALYCAKVCSYAQGMDLLLAASRSHDWNLNLSEIARIWKGGCIIRARFLKRIQQAYQRNPSLPNLLLDEELGGFIQHAQRNWRKIVSLAIEHGIPVLALGASLSYFDSYRRGQLPQNLTQAQRDYFGAHTYERVDRPAGQFFHTDW
jgi:6-phosphogluconate dehydrogenase